MSFNQNGAISILNNMPLKLVDQFIFLGRNISSTEIIVSICIGKAWTAVESLLTMWQSDKIKQESFQAVVVSVLLYGCTTLMKHLEKKLDGNNAMMLHAVWNNSLNQYHIHSQLPHPSHKLDHLDEQNMLGNYLKNTVKLKSNVFLWTSTYQCWLTSKNIHSSALCRHWMSSRGPSKSDGQ